MADLPVVHGADEPGQPLRNGAAPLTVLIAELCPDCQDRLWQTGEMRLCRTCLYVEQVLTCASCGAEERETRVGHSQRIAVSPPETVRWVRMVVAGLGRSACSAPCAAAVLAAFAEAAIIRSVPEAKR